MNAILISGVTRAEKALAAAESARDAAARRFDACLARNASSRVSRQRLDARSRSLAIAELWLSACRRELEAAREAAELTRGATVES